MGSQAIFSVLADLFPLPNATAVGNSSHPITLPAHAEPPTFSISSLPALLLSVVLKNQDMFKLFALGAIIEAFRRFSSQAWHWFLNSFFIIAHFDDTDETFYWMMVWMAKQSAWARAREVHISTRSWRQTHHKGIEIPGADEDSSDHDGGFQTKRKLAYLPAYETTHWLRFKYTWMSVRRSTKEGRDAWDRSDCLEISIFTRDRSLLRSLLLDAKKSYKAEDQDTVEIYGADQFNEWSRTSTRKKRPLRSIVLEPEIKSTVLNDAKDFLSNEKWYTDRGIPYRRGYLLHGVPGSGKTSLIHSIAGELGLDIYVVSLSKSGLDDTTLNDLICKLPSRSIALMEDVDAAFHHAGKTRIKASSNAEKGPMALRQDEKDEYKGVTLSGLLGALDGVAAQEGRILFATTNQYEALDEALCRPGRMDLHIEFKCATRWQAGELFRCFFPPYRPEDGEENVHTQVKVVGEEGEKTRNLMEVEVDELATRFAKAVPPDQFSMASLQGHLMRFKDRPYEAVEAVPGWVEKEALRRGTGVKDKKE